MKQAGRKFWLAVGFALLVAILLLFDQIAAKDFVELEKFAMGGYLGANVLHKAVEGGLALVVNNKESAG